MMDKNNFFNKTDTHIVFLTPGFPNNEKDSTTIPALQVYLQFLIEKLPRASLTILSFQFPFTKKTYHWKGIKIIPLNGKNKRLKKLFVWSKAFKILKSLNKNKPITTLHSFWIGECSLIAEKFSKKHKIAHIVTAMGQDVFKNNLYHKSITKGNIVTLSQNHHDLLLRNFNLNSLIIPWILDTSVFPELQKTEIDILGVGSLNEVKNYGLFINIISALVEINPELSVEIIGNGENETIIKEKIREKKLHNNIILTGLLDRKYVLKKMAISNVLLHTSTYESFGFVFEEALYSGMHVVSFNVGTAKSIPEWKICSSKEEMKTHLATLLNKSLPRKKRVLLHNKNDSLNAYLKLYLDSYSQNIL